LKEIFVEIFTEYSRYIVLTHIISAVIWVGGMFTIRFFVHPSALSIDSPVIRLSLILKYLKGFFNFVILILILLTSSAVLMAIGMNLIHSPLAMSVHIKEGILTLMILNFIIIYRKRNRAEKNYQNHNYETTKKELRGIPTFILLNIALGLGAIYFGVILRGF
jgi:uncharacterized membrane protein